MLGWALIATGIVVALGATVVLYRFPGWFLPWLKGTLGLLVVLVGVLVMAIGWSTLQWQRVSADRALYSLSVDELEEGTWWIELERGGDMIHEQEVSGGLLEISGRLLVLEVPFVGGEQSVLYQTGTIRGHDPESLDPVQFRAGPSRSSEEWVDLWWLDRRFPLPMVRAERLYPLVAPMADGARFRVVLQGNQIVPIPDNSPAEAALERME